MDTIYHRLVANAYTSKPRGRPKVTPLSGTWTVPINRIPLWMVRNIKLAVVYIHYYYVIAMRGLPAVDRHRALHCMRTTCAKCSGTGSDLLMQQTSTVIVTFSLRRTFWR